MVSICCIACAMLKRQGEACSSPFDKARAQSPNSLSDHARCSVTYISRHGDDPYKSRITPTRSLMTLQKTNGLAHCKTDCFSGQSVHRSLGQKVCWNACFTNSPAHLVGGGGGGLGGRGGDGNTRHASMLITCNQTSDSSISPHICKILS